MRPSRLLRLLIYVFAPLFTAQDTPGVLRVMIPQAVILGTLAAGVIAGLSESPYPVAAYFMAILAALSLLAGYRILSENDRLQEQRATLSVRWEDKHPYFWPQFGYRIGVWNEGPATAEGVDVTLEDITGDPYPAHMNANVLPSRLGHKDGYCQTDHCNINQHTEHFFDVLNFRERPSHGVWLLLTIAQTRIVLLEEKTYLFELVVSARNQQESAIRPVLEVRTRDDGLLDIRAFPSRGAYDDTRLTPIPSPDSTPGTASPQARSAP